MTNTKQKIRRAFLDLIAIDGVYPHEENVIQYVEQRLAAGNVAYQEDTFGNIIAKVPGTGNPVLLSTHLDIPEPNPDVRFTETGDLIQADGTCILGADPKTGLAVLLEFLCTIANEPASSHCPIETVLTRGEETGLFGSRNLDYSLVSAKMGLVLDEDGPVTQVVVRAPAFVRFDARIVGKVVHTREPENGINALQVLCEALTELPWGYIAPGVTWNIGVTSAGTARNSVPGSADVQGELRSFDTQAVVAQGRRAQETFDRVAKKYGTQANVKQELEFEGYELDRSHPLFERLAKTYGSMGLTPNFFETFGGSDANVFNANGITCVPIGSGYLFAHQYTETADLRAMEEIFEFLKFFCRT